MNDWISLTERVPDMAGTYLVGNDHGERPVGQARYQPRSRTWKFPSAAMGFEVTHWMPMPKGPK